MGHRFMVMKRRGIGGVRVSYVSLVLTLLTLLCSPAVHAEYTEPARVDAIEQARSGFSSGVTWVRLVDVACPGRTDGFFVVPSDTKQPLQLDVLLTAIDRGFRVELNYDRATCVVSTVVVCAAGSPC
jgi:hypothetical protein